MSPSPSASGPARSAAAVNEEIRALVRAAHGRLYGADRVRYAELVEEWAVASAAERLDVVEAA